MGSPERIETACEPLIRFGSKEAECARAFFTLFILTSCLDLQRHSTNYVTHRHASLSRQRGEGLRVEGGNVQDACNF